MLSRAHEYQADRQAAELAGAAELTAALWRLECYAPWLADRFWPDLCRRIGRPDLIEDPRFADGMSRFQNRTECVAELDAVFGSRTLAEWKAALAEAEGVWAPVQTAAELHDDPQVVANGYVTQVKRDDGVTFPLVANPVQFDGGEVVLHPAPEHGQHTEEILLELGCSWDEIAGHKQSGAIL